MTSALRLGFAAEALGAQGADIAVGRPNLIWNCEFRYDCEPSPPHARVLGLAGRPDFDVLVMHGASHLWAFDALYWAKRAGVRVVVDVDDLYDEISGSSIAHHLLDPGRSPVRNWRIIHYLCQTADVVTATTPLLAAHFGYGHGVVLPNLVPTSYLEISPAQRRDVIGWTGVLSAHEGDLQQTGGAVGQVLDPRPDWQFGSIGGRTEQYAREVREALGLTSEPFLQPFASIIRYPYLMAEFEIGIVPLAPHRFNAAKSALKMSQFAALGVPVVASPTPDNLRLHGLGVGLIAHSPADWRRCLELLLDDADARAELAARGRAVMATQTFECHANRWWDAWTSVIGPSPKRERSFIDLMPAASRRGQIP